MSYIRDFMVLQFNSGIIVTAGGPLRGRNEAFEALFYETTRISMQNLIRQ